MVYIVWHPITHTVDFLKRYGVIHRACQFSCVEKRSYTPEEFRKEVYEPWKNRETENQ